MKVSILQNVTIIIPSYYLHNYLKRSLEYYKSTQLELRILVVDSTDIPFSDAENYKIDYYHLPGMTYSKKLLFACNKVETDYIVLCSHDDVYSVHSIIEHAQFLEENLEYSASQGATVFYNMKYGRFNLLSYIDNSMRCHVDSDRPEERYEQQFENFTHQVYSVVRTPVFKQLFEYCDRFNLNDLAILELVQSGIYSINGKINFTSNLHYFQENLDHSAGSIYSTYEINRNNYLDHRALREILVNYLAENSKLSSVTVKNIIDNSLDNFLLKFADSFIKKLRKSIRKCLPEIMFKTRQSNYSDACEEKTLKFMSAEDIRQYKQTRLFLLQYHVKNST